MYLLGDEAIVETVDVITPIVDDPYTFGAISAANSVSDIYAMGGSPISALAILGFSSCDFSAPIIRELLRGAIDKLKGAGATLIGGHSIEDKEFKFGLSVTGRMSKDKILRINGALVGDILILTKPIGTGILSSAFKRRAIKNTTFNNAISSMLALNKTASEIAVLSGSHAATDITGFGLLGHALNMVKDNKIDFVMSYEKIPIMDGVKDIAISGIIPRGAHSNLEFVRKKVIFRKDLPKEATLILSDPQTSGGLLISVPMKGLPKFEQIAKKKKMPYWIIGEVIEGKGRIIVH